MAPETTYTCPECAWQFIELGYAGQAQSRMNCHRYLSHNTPLPGSKEEQKTTKILSQDGDLAAEIGTTVVDFVLDEVGVPPEEAIPGLMVAVLLLASETGDTSQALDEAVRLLDREEK